MRYLSLFSGIGGFEIGINAAYALRQNNVQPSDCPDTPGEPPQLPGHPLCVGFSEIDRHASSVYQRNFPGHNALGDITKLDAAVLPDFDLLVGGFPCQAFSVAGKRLGFDDTRGTLFFEIARILAVKKPRNFVLENVRGLLSHDAGRTFRTILAALNDLGYCVEWQVLNSKDFGVPQNRERVYIVGHLGGIPERKVFPICGGAIPSPARGGEKILHENISGSLTLRDTATALRQGASRNYQTVVAKIPEATAQGYALAEPGDSINLAVMGSATRRGRVGKGIAQTLDTGMQQHTIVGYKGHRANRPDEVSSTLKAGKHGVPGGETQGRYNVAITEPPRGTYHGFESSEFSPTLRAATYRNTSLNDGFRIRRLTPTECERLQAFPETIKYATISVCLDRQKSDAFAAESNHRSQKVACLAAGERLNFGVRSANQFLESGQGCSESAAQLDVRISLGENTAALLIRGKCVWSASSASDPSWSLLSMPSDDFVRLVAGVITTAGKTINGGKGESPARGPLSTHLGNGEPHGRRFGKETTQPADGATSNFGGAIVEPTKSTTSNLSETESFDSSLQTSCSSVCRAIAGFIPEEMQTAASFLLSLEVRSGWTSTYHDGKPVSDTQRYKMCGNAVTTSVVAAVVSRLYG